MARVARTDSMAAIVESLRFVERIGRLVDEFRAKTNTEGLTGRRRGRKPGPKPGSKRRARTNGETLSDAPISTQGQATPLRRTRRTRVTTAGRTRKQPIGRVGRRVSLADVPEPNGPIAN